jgi:hypothetical protein
MTNLKPTSSASFPDPLFRSNGYRRAITPLDLDKSQIQLSLL